MENVKYKTVYVLVMMLPLFGCGRVTLCSKTDDITLNAESIVLESSDVVSEATKTTNEIVESTTKEPEVTDEYIISDVPHIYQSSGYATACESIAAVSFMQYFGYSIEPEEFIEKYLPIAPYPIIGSDGNLYGETPWAYFIGNPLADNGYGCYNSTIVKAIRASKFNKNIQELHGVSLDTLCKTYIDMNIPVIIWGTIEMVEPYSGKSWYLPNGEYYTHIRPEHALLLIGYDSDNYYFSDSLAIDAITPYKKEAVEIAYDALYKQAIALSIK